ncbi:MAG: S-layer protein, partial [Candidatus Micrarchaeota archaeon]|nr:S-layer protein [Candidatus Micrarchaeota archaeon]
MKTMNAKRIAAVAAGAAMIGAAFAGAVSVDSGVGSYKFFSNDEPNVKIVVGSAAQASDAIAAANIAAMIGNLAYASSDITVVGNVTSPSGPVGAYKVRTMVEDNLDNAVVETDRNTTKNYYGGLAISGTLITPESGGFPKEVTGDLASGLLRKDYAVTNSKGLSLKESETAYLFSKTQFDDPTDTVVAKYARASYKVMFSNYLPYCLDTTKATTTCQESDLTEKNHVQIYFLGDKWTIVDMGLDSTNTVNQIILGKETAYNPIMQIGDELVAANGAKVKLKSISGIGYTTSYLPYASFEV